MNGNSRPNSHIFLTPDDLKGSKSTGVTSKLMFTSSTATSPVIFSAQPIQSKPQNLTSSVTERSNDSNTLRPLRRLVSPGPVGSKQAPLTPPRISSSKSRSVSCDSKKILTTSSVIHPSEISKINFLANGKYCNNVSISFDLFYICCLSECFTVF